MGMRMRGNENEGETYWVRTGSELAGVVSEWVLTELLLLTVVHPLIPPQLQNRRLVLPSVPMVLSRAWK